MPLMKCQKDGKSGWKYGPEGHCYTGPDAKQQATKQGQAIEISRHKKAKSNLSPIQKFLRVKEDTNE